MRKLKIYLHSMGVRVVAKQNDYFTTLPGGSFLLIPQSILIEIKLHAQHRLRDLEAGGIIIGALRRKDSRPMSLTLPPHIEVIGITTPFADDDRTRNSFVRKSKSHIKAVKKAKLASNNNIDYLGEWHTHPEDNPSPSGVDQLHWEKNLFNRHAVLIIVGRKSIWLGYWDGKVAVKLPALKLDK